MIKRHFLQTNGVVNMGGGAIGGGGNEDEDEDEVYVTRKNFVSDWVNQHQITTNNKTHPQQGTTKFSDLI